MPLCGSRGLRAKQIINILETISFNLKVILKRGRSTNAELHRELHLQPPANQDHGLHLKGRDHHKAPAAAPDCHHDVAQHHEDRSKVCLRAVATALASGPWTALLRSAWAQHHLLDHHRKPRGRGLEIAWNELGGARRQRERHNEVLLFPCLKWVEQEMK